MLVCEPLPGDLRESHNEPLAIVYRKFASTAIIETELHFIQIPEQVKRFHRNISSVHSALEQAPEILQPVCVNFAANVFNRMVNNLVSIFGFQSVVRR